MQSLENSSFKVAEENLMKCIREGKESLIQTREDIINGNLNTKDKYEELFERLYSLNLKPEIDKEVAGVCLKELIEELVYVFHNNMFDDKEYMKTLVVRIETAKGSLKHFLDGDELVKYEDILSKLKYHLASKLVALEATNMEKKGNKK